MAIKQVAISFYDIKQCGFYAWGSKSPTLSDMVETLKELRDWSTGKKIRLTKLKQSKGAMPVYLRGVDQLGDDWTVAIWNEVPAGEGGVASISEEAVVGGKQKIYVNEVEDKSIPGFATYFWFVPSKNVVATLRMEKSIAAKEPMRTYVETFLHTRSKYVVEDSGSAGTIIGYQDPLKPSEPVLKLSPRFRISPFSKPGALGKIKADRERIVKVIRTGYLEIENSADKAAFGGVLAFLRGANTNREVSQKRQLKVEMEMTPTKVELDMMIRHEIKSARQSSWEDLGFVLEGDAGTVLWVNKSLAREVFEMDLVVDGAGVVELSSLKSELAKRRRHILRILENG